MKMATRSSPHPLDSLSDRQREVLDLIAHGATNNAIAERLIISQNTVRAHVRELMVRTNAPNRTVLATMYLRGGPLFQPSTGGPEDLRRLIYDLRATVRSLEARIERAAAALGWEEDTAVAVEGNGAGERV